MVQTVLGVAGILTPVVIAFWGWTRSVDRRLDKLEQGQIGVSLQLQALANSQDRRHGE